ncbi:MAG: bifunctional histidinol-phosphatase/imidazoleglycerol-phosphate dehydratase HisB [Sphingobacteriaceae bacterium]|nr:bifunctional histidinol-phosphatase/imidazoleglycerol-phosphate dehydratase HisB [Sphingobacteriaceae bacterium]
MKKVLFIDRDGVLLHEPQDTFQIDSLEKFAFIPGLFEGLGRIARELDYELVMVSNQDGLGKPSYPLPIFESLQKILIDSLAGEGIRFSAIHLDVHTEAEIDWSLPPALISRKPGTAMLQGYLTGYDLANSFVIGDRFTDLELARNLGTQAIWFQKSSQQPPESLKAALVSDRWPDIYRYLRSLPRQVVVNRTTQETAIRVALNLDGSGFSRISTGIGFFDHMLEQLARHGGYDLELSCAGDLHIDAHHSIEDTALALGQAFREALGKKTGIQRYGFVLPMDDCLAQASLDFSGRPALQWELSFAQSQLGDFPTQMAKHFFESFAQAAGCNLQLQVTGENDHHKLESCFKAFARALRAATDFGSQTDQLPSTKGQL